MSGHGSDTSTKPRVLLSILKCLNFDHLGENDSLFTSITAGFGRFECGRLLKPSGIELMNLPQSTNIEISVLRKDRASNQKQLLYHGLVPLASINPHFVNSSPGQPQVWENWLGLFNADRSLKTEAPEQLFQSCLEMGASQQRYPRLLIRMQYLQGNSAPAPVPPSSSPGTRQLPSKSMIEPPASQKDVPSLQSPHVASENVAWKSIVGTVNGAGPARSPTGQSGYNSVGLPEGPVMPSLHSPPVISRTGASPGSAGYPPSSGVMTAMQAVQAVLPPTAAGTAVYGGSTPMPSPPEQAMQPSLYQRRPSKESNVGSDVASVATSQIGYLAPAAPPEVSVVTSSAGAFDPAASAGLYRSPSGAGGVPLQAPTSGGPGVDWREQYEVLAKQMMQNRAVWDEKHKALESSLQEAEKSAYHKAERGTATSDSATVEQQETPESPQRGPHKLANYVQQCTELQKQMALLQKQLQQVEQEKAQLRERDSIREADLSDLGRRLLERAGPALERLGRPIAAVDPSAEFVLQEAVSALTAVADGEERYKRSQEALEAMERAAQGEEVFETWLAGPDLPAEMRTSMQGNAALMALCRQVASSARVANSEAQALSNDRPLSVALLGEFYHPIKTDPVDCLLAAHLLRLHGSPPNFTRLKAGVYRFGPHGLRLHCGIDQGLLKVRVTDDLEATSRTTGNGEAEAVEVTAFLREQGVVSA